MIETPLLKNVVIFIQTILSFVLPRKIINFLCVSFFQGSKIFSEHLKSVFFAC